MSPLRLQVTATGMVSSVGLSAAASCAAIRAGLSAFEALPYRDDMRKPIVGSPVPVLPWDMGRQERLVDLLAMAVADVLHDVPADRLPRVPLLVAVAETDRPGGGADFSGELVSQVERRLERTFHPHLSRVLHGGSAAGFQTLRLAQELLGERRVSACLVCAVDSLLNAQTLLWLQQKQRLKTARNSDGIIPGEAAACVWVEDHPAPRRPVLVTVRGLGLAREPAPLLSEEPLRGVGLAQAARAALEEAGLHMQDMAVRLSDASGESYGFKEQTLALTRLLRVKRETMPLWLCAESIGEVGAAASLCQVVRAAQASLRGYEPGAHALCFASSVPGERAAAVLQWPNRPTLEEGT
ncbi:hypothetical protein [Archangium sp.]|uniref:hypothetical protein n=1 Tax=Archangium sp. TaxID=1872627 RepID=UPI002D5DB223|nr:hypothetical protein [Archangium sp.]HYO51761.1 hypothetical protein [Archangium sp.]